MLRKLRSYRPTHATVVACLALFVALGGTAYAAATIGSAQVIDNSLRSVDLKNNAGVTSADVVDGSLLARDLRAGALGGTPVAVARNPVAKEGDPDPCVAGQAGVFCGYFTGERKVWENSGQGYAPVRFSKDAAGVVHLSGAARASAPQAPQPTFFILPPSYRPSTRHAFTTWCAFASEGPCRVDVRPDGRVDKIEGEAGLGFTSFDGISFRAGG